jgi:hypothetical protein
MTAFPFLIKVSSRSVAAGTELRAEHDSAALSWLPDTCGTMREPCAYHLLEYGYGIGTAHKILGHRDVSTTMMHTHVLNRGERGVRSPVDALTRAPRSSQPYWDFADQCLSPTGHLGQP